MKKEIITAPDAPAAVGPYSHAVKKGNMLFLSGQIPLNPETGEMPKGIEAQMKIYSFWLLRHLPLSAER